MFYVGIPLESETVLQSINHKIFSVNIQMSQITRMGMNENKERS